jgi:hypothetical protein
VSRAATWEETMRSPAYGLAWQLWRHYRRGITGFLVYGIGVALFAQTAAAARLGDVRILAVLPLMFGLLYLMAVFTHPEADVAATRSGYPAYLWVLPVRTWELVLWPMLYGTTAIALAWIGLACFILSPLGMHAPVGWPAAMFAALLACMQALFWCPIGLPYLRVSLALVALPVLASVGLIGWQSGVSPTTLTAGFLGLIPPACLAAIAGLSTARRGDSPEWRWLPSGALSSLGSRLSARQRQGLAARQSGMHPSLPRAERRETRDVFSSPAQAQLWLEWRRNGRVLPLLVTVACLFATIPLIWTRDTLPLDPTRPPAQPGEGVGSIAVNVAVRAQETALLIPPIFALIVGCGVRRSDNRQKDLGLDPFLATRPMSSSDLVLAKLKAAAGSTLAAWAIMLLFVAGWLLTPARDEERAGPLIALLLRYITPGGGLAVLGLLLILMVWTWSNQVQGLFVDLTGRAWLVYAYPLAVATLVTAFLWTLAWLDRTTLTRALELLPRLAAIAVLLKLLAAGWALHALRRRGLLQAGALAAFVGAWLILAASHFALLQALLPPGFIQPRDLALAVVLFLPLARIAAAPLALEWNRHR